MSMKHITLLFLWLVWTTILLAHIHTDVTAIQARLGMLTEAGSIKPEYRR